MLQLIPCGQGTALLCHTHLQGTFLDQHSLGLGLLRVTFRKFKQVHVLHETSSEGTSSTENVLPSFVDLQKIIMHLKINEE